MISPSADEDLKAVLRQTRIATPSPACKERALRAARAAWDCTRREEVPPLGPLLRLAACLLMAVMPTALIHVMASRQLETGASTATGSIESDADIGDLFGETLDPSLVRFSLARARAAARSDRAEAMRNYMRMHREWSANGS